MNKPKIPLKIVLAIDSLGLGGAERQLSGLAKMLKTKGHEVKIIFPNYAGTSLEGKDEHFATELLNLGIPIKYAGRATPGVPQWEGLTKIVTKLASIKLDLDFLNPIYREMVFGYVQEFIEDEPDIVHAWLDATNMYAGLAAAITEVPKIILSFRNMAPTHFKQCYFRGLESHYTSLARNPRCKLIANSNAAARSYAKWLNLDLKKISIIHNGVDYDNLKPYSEDEKAALRARLGIKEKAVVLTGAFRFTFEKRPFVFANLATEALERYQYLHLIVVGNGEHKKRFVEIFEEKNLADRAIFINATQELHWLLQISDIFLSASRYEGMPNTVMEAILNGCAVLATKAGGIEELLDYGAAGTIVPPDDKWHLRRELFKLIENNDLRKQFSERGKKNIIGNFSNEKMFASIINLYFSERDALDNIMQKTKKFVIRNWHRHSFWNALIPHIVFRLKWVERLITSKYMFEPWKNFLFSVDISHSNNIYNTIANFQPYYPGIPSRNQIKVLMFIGSLGPGGSERQAVYLALELKKLDIDVEFVTMEDLSGTDAHYLPILRKSGIAVQSIAGDTDPTVKYSRLFSFKQASRLPRPLYPSYRIAAKLMQIQPTIIHCWLDQTNVWGAIAGILSGMPGIIMSTRSVNPTHFYKDRGWMKRWYQHLLKNRYIGIINNSETGAKDYARWIGVDKNRIEVIENGLIIEEGDRSTPRRSNEEIRGRLGVTAGEELILGVMRFTNEKRPELFVKTCLLIFQERPLAKAILVGNGPMFGKIKRLVDSSRFGNRLNLVGTSRETADLMRVSDLLILTSRQEGSPNVLIEAQSAGCPVLTTAAGGAVDTIVDGVTGFIVPEKPEKIAKKACSILENESLKASLINAGPPFVQANFRLDTMVKKTLKLYHQILHGT